MLLADQEQQPSPGVLDAGLGGMGGFLNPSPGQSLSRSAAGQREVIELSP